MATTAARTVRAVFEAKVSGAQKGMRDLSKDVSGAGKQVDTLAKDLKALDTQKVAPTIDVKIDEAKKRLSAIALELADLKKLDASPEVTAKIDDAKKRMAEVRAEIRDLQGQKVEFRVNAQIDQAERRVKEITQQLGELRTLEATPEVTADIRQAQRNLRDARTELRELNAAKATMQVRADTDGAKRDIAELSDDVADAGAEGGDEAGENIVQGILGALQTIPIAGAVIGVGAAIAGGILLGIKQGLAIEAERDLFGAQTGLDEATANRFGRAAGEAYAQAWGDSVAANLDTARRALAAGIIDTDATDAEIQNVIAKLQGLNDLFEYDIAMSVQGVGNLMKTGLVRDADEAFDLIVAASQRLPSDDLIETLNEYSNQFVTLGLEGQEAFGLIVQGAEAGARDTDKVADSLKELGLRIREGLDPARDALSALDLDVEDTIAAFQEGGPRAAEAVDRVFDALRVLKEEGGNTQEVIAALFGGPGEDLGAALFALDLDTVTEAIGGVEGAAGAADRALETMADNAATDIEAAKRSIEIAMDGIKGALASAFSDEISGASEWVSRNRAPLMEFFLDVINGAFEMGIAFVDFGATALEAVATFAEQAGGILQFLPGFSIADKRALDEEAANIRTFAGQMRSDLTAALEDSQRAANDWAMPEIMAARVNDATVAMAEDLRDLENEVGTTEFTVKINGDTLNAEEALAVLTENIDASDGTVRINGDKVPAEDAVDRLMELIEDSEGDVTVGGDVDPARDRVGNLMKYIGGQSASVKVRADTSAANATLSLFLRDRTVRVRVVTDTSRSTIGGLARHDGGWIGTTLPGLYAGGRVPGSDPGYDNVLWPLRTGGMTLAQPLAGGEYVVNSRDSAFWAPVLELMNSGWRPSPTQITETTNNPINIGTLVAADVRDFEHKAQQRAAYARMRRQT